MSAIAVIRELLRAPKPDLRARVRRRLAGAFLLVCYVVGTVGLPVPPVSGGTCQHAGAGGRCCCSAASILAGTCCCRQPAVTRSCCVDKRAPVEVRTELRKPSKKEVTRSCCDKPTASNNTASQKPADNELRLSGCPCAPGAPDATLICVDPRLPLVATAVMGAPRVEFAVPLPSVSAPSGTLEPQTPPPRA